MDKIYPPSKFPCCEHIPLKNTFLKYSEACSLNTDPNFEMMTEKEQNETLPNMLKINSNKLRKQLLDDISIDLLTVEGESCPDDNEPPSNKIMIRIREPCEISKEALELETVKMRNSYQNRFKDLYIRHKHRKEPYICQAAEKSEGKDNIGQGMEFAIAIRVYHPFQFNYSMTNSYHNLKFSHEIIAIGSNTLADLRDKIICHEDAGLAVEVEDPKTDLFIENAKDKYPSGFIFIDNVFYTDDRHPNSFDYSEVIRQWAAEKNIGPLQYSSLETTRIDELTPRFGYPYVYQHQGRCEHILVFSDAWLLTAKDSLNSKDYPTYSGIHRFYGKHCTMCYAQGTKWICVNSDRLPHAKTFLCQECFVNYNFKDGKKLGEFRAYPFFDRSGLI